ncbi:hypothetical protein EJB05_06363, partial [Eragrostis curvula]
MIGLIYEIKYKSVSKVFHSFKHQVSVKNLALIDRSKRLTPSAPASARTSTSRGPPSKAVRRARRNRTPVVKREAIFHGAIAELFARKGLRSRDVEVVVVNVSRFYPAPSLVSRLVRRNGMHDDVATYNLAGMGCSAVLAAVDVARNAVVARAPRPALCLFCCGGAAALLTSDPALRERAKMELRVMVRSNIAADADGRVGIGLNKALPNAAVSAFAVNLRAMAPRVLPVATAWQKLWRRSGDGAAATMVNIKAATVIDAVKRSLGLDDGDVEPSRMILHRWGNTLASSVWYVLSYMEAKGRLKKGDRVIMLTFGSAFKFNSCMWEVIGHMADNDAWAHCIDGYPPESLVIPSGFEGYRNTMQACHVNSMVLEEGLWKMGNFDVASKDDGGGMPLVAFSLIKDRVYDEFNVSDMLHRRFGWVVLS